MGAEDATADTILEVIIERAYLLGGINLSEQCTNFLTSLMIVMTSLHHPRGPISMSVRERKGWHSYLKAELKAFVRDSEPLEYIVELPATPNLMKKEYPKQYAAAYPNGDEPIKVPPWLHAAVICFDSTYNRRGGNTKNGDTSDLTASLEALGRLMAFRQQEAREPTLPGWNVFEKPAGKPMRILAKRCSQASFQDRSLLPIEDVSPGGGDAQKEEKNAQAEHQEKEKEKEKDPLEEEDLQIEDAAPAAIVAVEKTEKDEKDEKDEKEAVAPLASVAVEAIIIRTKIVTMIIIRIIRIGIRLRRRGRRRRRRITIG